MDMLPEILARRSVRAFSPEPVDKATLERILEAGRLSPSAKNRQEWRFIVIQRPELIESIQNAAFGQEHVGSAPAIIAACTTNIDYRMPNGQLSYPIDTSFAVSFMLLQAVREERCECLVLGAFGCGAFGNPPQLVAAKFAEALSSPEFRGAFGTVVFAILGATASDTGNLASFHDMLGRLCRHG